MRRILSKLRKTDYYDFDHGLTLMNILYKTEDGTLDRIETYIGVDRNNFTYVGGTEGLAKPGVLFSYADYTRLQQVNRANYLMTFKQNCKSHIFADGRAYTVEQYLETH